MSAPFDLDVMPIWGPEMRWHALLARAIDACAKDAGDGWPGRPISVLLCADSEIRSLNKQWRGFDKPTNVLSFPAAGPTHPNMPLGDIAIAYETSSREAGEAGKTLDDHVTHLAVHGVLHLLGDDHETSADADAMEARERRILDGLGIADPYAGEPMMEHAR